MTARTGKDPGELYDELAGRLGKPLYVPRSTPRLVAAAEKATVSSLAPEAAKRWRTAGGPIASKMTKRPQATMRP